MEQNPTGQPEQKSAEPAPVVQQPAGQPAGGQPPKKSNSNAIVIIIVVVVVLGIMALVGGYFVMKSLKAKVSQTIGQKIGENMVEKAIEQSTGQKADVSADGNAVSVKTDNGSWSASGAGDIKLPSDFPSDIYIPSDAKITFATSTQANPKDGSKASAMIGFTVNQVVADVVSKYLDEMVKNGWTKESDADFGARMINFKKDTRDVLVTVADSQGDKTGATGVSITVSEN